MLIKLRFNNWHSSMFIGNHFLSIKRWLFLCAIWLSMDYLIFEKLATKFLEDDNDLVQVELEQPNRISINQLVSKLSIPIAKPVEPSENDEKFAFKKVVCNRGQMVRSERSRFHFCYPPKLLFRFQQRQSQAYFINGQRDVELEKRFRHILFSGTTLRVFTRPNSSERQSSNERVKNFRVVSFTEDTVDSEGQPIIGIKDLLDLNGKIDPLVFAVNIPVFASHLLLRLEKFPYSEFRTLIRRLAGALYFSYAVEFDQKQGVHFVSLMHKYSMHRFSVGDVTEDIWSQRDHQMIRGML